ncbi:MAG: hypothetical protein HY899_14485 [Deltaproteobacteria bacterium]|nr:hypothetical protein [Deltaproteobacteria bacterium]
MVELGTFALVVVVVQLVAAAGIVGFWMTAGRAAFDEPWRPPGFALHERAFTTPDTIAAALMALSAVLVLGGRPLGRSLGLVAAGMLLFLAVIDTVYMQQNDLFRPERDGRMHTAIVVAVFAVCGLMLVAYLM